MNDGDQSVFRQIGQIETTPLTSTKILANMVREQVREAIRDQNQSPQLQDKRLDTSRLEQIAVKLQRFRKWMIESGVPSDIVDQMLLQLSAELFSTELSDVQYWNR